MSEVSDEARKIAVAWSGFKEGGEDISWIGNKVKLASDIENYARFYCHRELQRIRAGLDNMITEQLATDEK